MRTSGGNHTDYFDFGHGHPNHIVSMHLQSPNHDVQTLPGLSDIAGNIDGEISYVHLLSWFVNPLMLTINTQLAGKTAVRFGGNSPQWSVGRDSSVLTFQGVVRLYLFYILFSNINQQNTTLQKTKGANTLL